MAKTSSNVFLIHLKRVAIVAVCLFVFCEWLIYYLVIYQCSWPELHIEGRDRRFEPLRTMLLTDTHLLGQKRGHWFDKLRREWQMERAFQTAVAHFKPDVVFLLGDLFDEGLISNDEEWDFYVQRFRKMFHHSENTEFHVVVGNHDIGFHPDASKDSHLFGRFSSVFDSPSVKLLTIKGNIFVLVNSIALQGDDCSMCSEAMRQLHAVGDKLNCHQRSRKEIFEDMVKQEKTFCELPKDFPPPILIQHFPLYRETEMGCTGIDAPPLDLKQITNREKWEVVSKEMSNTLLSLIRPRLVFSGHTHHGCYLVHEDGTPEMTIPSFSWRNRNNPSFVLIIAQLLHAEDGCFLTRAAEDVVKIQHTMLFSMAFNMWDENCDMFRVCSFQQSTSWNLFNDDSQSCTQSVITPERYALSKCFIPQESTVIAVYVIAGLAFVLVNFRLTYLYLKTRRTCRQISFNCCVR